MIKVPQEALDFIANGPEVSGVLAAPSQDAGEQMRQQLVAAGMSTTQTAGEYLCSCRVAAGLGLTETAEMLGITTVELGEIERNKCYPDRIPKALNPYLLAVGFDQGAKLERAKPLRDALNPYFIVSELPKGTIPKALDTARHEWAAALLHETDPDNRAIVKDEIRRILQFVVIYWEQDELMSKALAALKAWEE